MKSIRIALEIVWFISCLLSLIFSFFGLIVLKDIAIIFMWVSLIIKIILSFRIKGGDNGYHR